MMNKTITHNERLPLGGVPAKHRNVRRENLRLCHENEATVFVI